MLASRTRSRTNRRMKGSLIPSVPRRDGNGARSLLLVLATVVRAPVVT